MPFTGIGGPVGPGPELPLVLASRASLQVSLGNGNLTLGISSRTRALCVPGSPSLTSWLRVPSFLQRMLSLRPIQAICSFGPGGLSPYLAPEVGI